MPPAAAGLPATRFDAGFAAWTSLPGMFMEQAARHADKPLLRAKRKGAWERTSWREARAQVEAAAAGLAALGVGRGDRVCLVAENRPEWLVADLAIMALGAITVPAYTTIGTPDYAHVLRDSGAVLVIVSGPALGRKVFAAAHEVPTCRTLVSIGASNLPSDTKLAVLDWDALLAGQGTQAEGEEAPPPPDIRGTIADLALDDPACIIYTSGTGGAPKGVVLSHRAVLANCRGAVDVISEIGIGDELFLSCLPLSHAYEHSCGQFFPLTIGAEIAYVEGIDKIGANLQEVKPTIVMVVPRLCEVVQQRMLREVERQPALNQRMFRLALELGRERYRRGGRLPLHKVPVDRLMTKLVRAKVQAKLGGRVKGLISGGAALNPEVGIFFAALGFPLLQGYGQTEAAPLISVNRFGNPRHETVGPPVRDCEVRVAADGELLVRGPNVMLGYWNDPASTERALHDGWLHTGDVGHMDEAGRIVITDRKKDLLVTSGGDNVSPARVEGHLTLEPEIAQAVVCGDKKPYITAILVPDAEIARDWAQRRGKPDALAELVRDPDFRRLVSDAVDRANRGLSGVERIRKFILVPDPFTMDNGLMTPTLKIKRTLVLGAYREQVEGLYE